MSCSLRSNKAFFIIVVILSIFVSTNGKQILKGQVDNVNVYLVPARNSGYKHPINIKPEIVLDCLYKIAEKNALIFKKNKEVLVNIKKIPFFIFIDSLKMEKDSNVIVKEEKKASIHIFIDSVKIEKLSKEIANALEKCTYKKELSIEQTKKRIPRCIIFSTKDITIRFNYIWRLRPVQGFWMEFTRDQGKVVDEAGIGIVIEQFPPQKKVRKKKKNRRIYPIVK